MADPAATLGGVSVPAGPVSVRVSCAPTYALSHRFGKPDDDGVARCACGRVAESGWESPERHACDVHCPAVARAQAEGLEDFQVYRDLVYDTVEAERQRCERLGVEWVPPHTDFGDEWGVEHGILLLNARDVRRSMHWDSMYEQTRLSREGRLEMQAGLCDDGGIVRHGCELREADGARAR